MTEQEDFEKAVEDAGAKKVLDLDFDALLSEQEAAAPESNEEAK